MKKIFLSIIAVLSLWLAIAQTSFDYQIELNPISIPNLPSLHSYAVAQHNGKWLIIGGRLDGLHARQPWAAFPESDNNATIFVVDVATQQFWSASTASLPTNLKEQLQATNINFQQDENDLILIGGYAYAASQNDHITFPYLTKIDVAGLSNAVMQGTDIQLYFQQIYDERMANTGGQLGKIGDTFYLVGGQRFDGRYNPHNNPTFVQTYSEKVAKFTLDETDGNLNVANYETIEDATHFHRRDYNMHPQIFPDGTLGFTMFAGVFQVNVDLPILYTVDVFENNYTPNTNFNQYFNQYHSASAMLYDENLNEMHNLFFGGMSQYYFDENDEFVQDDLVPFVNTISRVSRDANGNLEEVAMNVTMPAMQGASAEFIPNQNLPSLHNDIIDLASIAENEFIIGHIYGGIQSPERNPFSYNNTGVTYADNVIYEVKLLRQSMSIQEQTPAKALMIYPNPTSDFFHIEYFASENKIHHYFITDDLGQMLQEGFLQPNKIGINKDSITLHDLHNQLIFFNLISPNNQIVSEKVLVK